MSDKEKSDVHTESPPKSAVVLLLGTMADTTWRMFVPTLTGMTAGYYADKSLGSWPWLFVAGTILGCVIAGLLVAQQLKNKS